MVVSRFQRDHATFFHTGVGQLTSGGLQPSRLSKALMALTARAACPLTQGNL